MKSVKFYSETLGFKIANKNENLKFVTYDAGGVTPGTYVPWEGDTGRGIGGVTGLIFQTPDIESPFQRCEPAGSGLARNRRSGRR